MNKLICKRHAYEAHTGERHILEAFTKDAGAPYLIMVDGAFLATAETRAEIADEMEGLTNWFGWTNVNPNVN